MDRLGRNILSIIERLSSFRGKMYWHYIGWYIVLYTEVSFIQSVLYQRFHCIQLLMRPDKLAIHVELYMRVLHIIGSNAG